MAGSYLSPLALGFAAFRLAWVIVALGALLVLWRRPRPAAALVLVVGLNVVAWAAYVAPLPRLYALEEGTDRAFNVGMASSVAAGHSIFEHTQVGFGAPEPFWNGVVAALACFRIEWTMPAYGALAPLSLLVVGLGLYFGLRTDDSERDAWERVLIVFAVLGLSSLSMHPRPPAPALWMGNFLLKPDHAMAWGVVGIALGQRARRESPWRLGLVLGLLAWVFLLDWAYLLAGFVVLLLLDRRGERDARGLVTAAGLSIVLALPYLVHLARDYSPLGAGRAARHMWDDPRGLPLAVPNWTLLDLGPLLVLGVGGLLVLWQRRSARDRTIVAVAAASWGLWALSIPGALLGFAPEPEELHYFLRVVMGIAAGSALAAAARHVETVKGLTHGRGHLMALAACIPFSFVAYWDPPQMDRYYPSGLLPLRVKVLSYGEWIRRNTPPDAVFVAGRSAATWIPVLTGRRVLLNEAGNLLPADHAARKEAERILVTEEDPGTVRTTARAHGVSYLAIDWPLTEEYGAGTFEGLAPSAAWQTVFTNAQVRILVLRPEDGGPGYSP